MGEQSGFKFPCFRSDKWLGTIMDGALPLPTGVMENMDITPDYMARWPTANLFPAKMKETKEKMRRMLFRQALFKIQNVEVTQMETCKSLRTLKEVTNHMMNPTSGRMLMDSWEGRETGECLKSERWTVDRCGTDVMYDIRYYKEKGVDGAYDGYSTTVTPVGLRDKCYAAYYYASTMFDVGE